MWPLTTIRSASMPVPRLGCAACAVRRPKGSLDTVAAPARIAPNDRNSFRVNLDIWISARGRLVVASTAAWVRHCECVRGTYRACVTSSLRKQPRPKRREPVTLARYAPITSLLFLTHAAVDATSGSDSVAIVYAALEQPTARWHLPSHPLWARSWNSRPDRRDRR